MKLSLAALLEGARESEHSTQFLKRFPGFYLVRMGLAGGQVSPTGSAAIHQTCEFDPSTDEPLFRPKSDDQSGDAFEIPRQTILPAKVTIGRAPFAFVQLRESSVSGQHAEIVIRSRELVTLRDLSSKNGTRLNHKLLPSNQSIPLNCGDLISFGRFSLQFYRPESLYPLLKLLTR